MLKFSSYSHHAHSAMLVLAMSSVSSHIVHVHALVLAWLTYSYTLVHTLASLRTWTCTPSYGIFLCTTHPLICTHQLYMWQTINLCDNDGTHKHSHPHKCARILHLTARVYVYRGHWSISVYPIETELVYSPCFPAVICMQSSLELFLLTTPCTWSSHVNTGSS